VAKPRLVAALSALAIVACASRFDPASKIVSLRVLAVQKDKPYAHPGDTVHLRMLLTNGAAFEDAGKGKEITVTWLTGCQNPDGDEYLNCFADLAKPGANLLKILGSFQQSVGLETSLTLSPDILDRPAPQNPDQPINGSAFVFFVACAGYLDVAKSSTGFPFACFDRDTQKQLGADEFVAGYTEVFAYRKVTNANPIVKGIHVDGKSVVPDCIGEACIELEQRELQIASDNSGSPVVEAGAPPSVDSGGLGRRDAEASMSSLDATARDGSAAGGSSSAGGAPAAPPPTPPITCGEKDPACFDVCTTDDQNKCPKIIVDVDMDQRDNAESDSVQESIEHRTVQEQMWVNYYSDAGKYEHDVKLLRDATTGWNPAHSADLRIPQEIGHFHVWTVAHDNRGGTEWARITLATRPPLNGFP
jgi:hypothetical protein